MYQVGDYVVKSATGICQVKDIVHPDFVPDRKKLYYLLTPLADPNANLYVAIDKTEDSMRNVMTVKEANALMQKIPSIQVTWIANEREREQNYKKALQSNDPEKLVGVIKLLYQRKQTRERQGKKTTAVDGRYFKLAEDLLYAELETSLQKNREEIYELIWSFCETSL